MGLNVSYVAVANNFEVQELNNFAFEALTVIYNDLLLWKKILNAHSFHWVCCSHWPFLLCLTGSESQLHFGILFSPIVDCKLF